MSAGSNVAEASVPVDLLNPGQVFACIGFADAADALLGDAEGYFDWSNREAVRFHLRASGSESPIERVLRFLSKALVIAQAPHGSRNIAAWNKSWGDKPDELPKGMPYASADPESPATLVAVLRASEGDLRIDHWTDTVRDNVKFWAGAGGYPGAVLTRDALDLAFRGTAIASANDPFALAVPQSSSFRLDWRRDYVPIDAGFSLNAHGGAIGAIGYPLVEILGAIGLTHARPQRLAKLEYRYGVVGTSREALWLPLSFLRSALGKSALPFESRWFHMSLSWPGKEEHARAITHVTEGQES